MRKMKELHFPEMTWAKGLEQFFSAEGLQIQDMDRRPDSAVLGWKMPSFGIHENGREMARARRGPLEPARDADCTR